MKSAFSLVELSIVLVILGLLTGGILTGKNLIRAAEIRSVTSDLSRYQTAIMIFRDQYFAFPGDMTDATEYWGAADNADGAGSDCFTAAVTDARTCNGNGDGLIDDPAGATAGSLWLFGERYMAWKHLANAGLVEGNYTGRTNSATNNNQPTGGVNVPSSRMSNSYFGLAQLDGTSVSTFYNPYRLDKNILFFGMGTLPLLGKEAWTVDTKIDDGFPGLGKLTSIDWDNANGKNCADNGDPLQAKYQLTNSNKGCSLAYFF